VRSLPANPKLAPNQVHVWQISLAAPGTPATVSPSPLSEDELQRANRFHFEKDRLRFIAARSALRNILATYLNLPPREVAFSYASGGKPALAPHLNHSALHFNLSHSHDYALLAITPNSRVGADIEFINPDRATGAIAQRFFSPAEAASLQALPPAKRTAAFFQCWTRKEAYVKALGAGLSLPLSSFEVAFGPGVPASLLRIRNSPEMPSNWRLHDIPAPQGYAAAVAVDNPTKDCLFQIWHP